VLTLQSTDRLTLC